MKWVTYEFEGKKVRMPYDEGSVAIAQKEADGGVYTIEDDGQSAPVTPEADTATWDELATALQEGVNLV